MARINFENEIYKDPRFQKLIIKTGDLYTAKGMLVTAWELAQNHWLKFKAVPKKAWPDELNVLIDFQFAERTFRGEEEYIYVKGSKDRCKFLEQASAAGKAKSEKKLKAAENARKVKSEGLNARSKKTPKKAERPNIGSERELNGSEPLYSNLFTLNSESLDSDSLNSAKVSSKPAKKGQLFIAAYCRSFKTRYGFNPEIMPQDARNAKNWVADIPEDKIELYVQAFFAMPDAWLTKVKHPIGVFKNKFNEIIVFANSGKFHTNTQTQQADAFASNALLLDEIRNQQRNNEV